MGFIWTEEWATGNQTIDTQHQELFLAINSLLDSLARGDAVASLVGTVEFLREYASRHFADEERLGSATNYPGMEKHRQFHASFKRDIAAISQQMADSGPSADIANAVTDKIGNWLVNHLMTEDVKLAAYVETYATEQPASARHVKMDP